MRTLITTLLAVFLMASSVNAAPSQLNSFYGENVGITTKEALVERLGSPNLKADKAKLVATYNANFGARLGQVSSFEELLAKIGSSDYEVRPCTGSVANYGITPQGAFVAIRRACYRGELMLVHRATGLAVFSLWCGNLQKPPAAEACVEIPIQRSGGSSTTALLHVWSGSLTPACGLKIANCPECLDINGVPSIAFHAKVIVAADGIEVVRLPVAMVVQMQKLCIGVLGYLTPNKFHDWIYQPNSTDINSMKDLAGTGVVRLRSTPLLYIAG